MVKTLVYLLLSAVICDAQPAILGVTNGASYSGNLAPGTCAAIFGAQLAPATLVADTVPLPLQLNSVSVTFGGIAAPLRFISPSQINAVIPFELNLPLAGVTVPVVVTTPTGTSTAFNVLVSRNSPGVFTQDASAGGNAWVFDPNFRPVASIGTDPVILYATGLGPTNPAASSPSGGASTEPLNRIQDQLSVFIGDKPADILFAGLAPGFPGIYQLNVVPHGAVTDRVYLKINGWQSNFATVPLAAGANVTNLTGSIDGLFPSSLPLVTAGAPTGGPVFSSVMLTAARFAASVDILPNAKPFSIVATSEGGSAVIEVDPVQGTWHSVFSAPTLAARAGDFSVSEFVPVLDFSRCTPARCNPFPNSIIPVSRFDPVLLRAQRLIPFPNTSSTRSANATVTASGTFSGTHFDSSAIGESFGGFVQIPHAGPSTRTSPFRLYIDGRLVASKDVTYPVI